MPDTDPETMPVPITGSAIVAGVLHGITPVALKSLSRLVGAGLDYPAAWVERWTEGVRTKTASLKTVESAIAHAVANDVTADTGVVARAGEALLRKEYRNQVNREAVAVGTAKLLLENSKGPGEGGDKDIDLDIDDDWFNVFERHAEDASTERMQSIWSKVLAGEIQRPGTHSVRTLRCLAEMSQADALQFSECVRNAISNFIPKTLLVNGNDDIRPYLDLEVAGLISGISSPLNQIFKTGVGALSFVQGDIILIFQAVPDSTITFSAVMLSPIAMELLSVLPDRDIAASMRRVAFAIREPALKSATINRIVQRHGTIVTHLPQETLWEDGPQSVAPL